MRKYLLLIFLFLAPVFSFSPLDDVREMALKFDIHYGVWERKLYGCPANYVIPVNDENCDHKKATFDYQEFKKAKEEAKIVFGLKDK